MPQFRRLHELFLGGVGDEHSHGLFIEIASIAIDCPLQSFQLDSRPTCPASAETRLHLPLRTSWYPTALPLPHPQVSRCPTAVLPIGHAHGDRSENLPLFTGQTCSDIPVGFSRGRSAFHMNAGDILSKFSPFIAWAFACHCLIFVFEARFARTT